MGIEQERNDKLSLAKDPAESYCSYIWRVDSLIRQGIYNNWSSVVDIVNKEIFGNDEINYKGESAYRKEVASARKFFEAGIFATDSEDIIKQIREEQDKLYAIKRQVADQRREYNKLIIQDGRANNLTEKLLECANKMNKTIPLKFDVPSLLHSSGKECVMVWSDWHYGMITHNIWNEYNIEICRARIKKFIEKSIEYLTLFKIEKLHIINCGDAFHGSIHLSCRVASEENTCDQIMEVSELMAESIYELSKYVNKVVFYSCYGNHERTIQNKDESIHADNLGKIIPWWIKQRLRDNTNITVVDSEYKEFMLIDVLGYNIICVHGDLDDIKNVATTINTLFTRKYGKKVDYIISGDKHHLEEFERFDIESIIVRSLCGTDDYANNKRLYSCPGQTLIIFNKDEGRECTRNVKVW